MLHAWQLRPIQSLVASLFFQHKHLMVILPRQEGKTELGVRLGRQVISHPKDTRQGLFLTKSKEAAKKMTREKFSRVFDPDEFQVNTEIIVNKAHPASCMYVDSVDKRPDKLRGGTYALIHWAEVAFSEFDHGVTVHDVYHKILKPTLRETKGYSFLESTTNGKNGWYELFESAKDLGYFPVRYSLSQLVEMGLRTRQEYDELKKSTPDLVFKQEYECEFVTFSGLAYDEMAKHHIWQDMPAPQDHNRVYIAIDWGFNPSATCVLFGYVIDGRICIFDEIYEKEKLISELAVIIKHKMNQWNLRSIGGVGDHEPRSIKELNNYGIPVSPCEKADVLGNRMDIKTLFKQDKLYIHPRCTWLLKDLNAATWDFEKRGEINYSSCSWGHFDGEAALRYFVRQFKDIKESKPRDLPIDPQALHELALRGH